MPNDREQSSDVSERDQQSAEEILSAIFEIITLSQIELCKELIDEGVITEEQQNSLIDFLENFVSKQQIQIDKKQGFTPNMLIGVSALKLLGGIFAKSPKLLQAIDKLIQSLDPKIRDATRQRARGEALQQAIENMKRADKIKDANYRDKFKDLIWKSVTTLTTALMSASSDCLE